MCEQCCMRKIIIINQDINAIWAKITSMYKKIVSLAHARSSTGHSKIFLCITRDNINRTLKKQAGNNEIFYSASYAILSWNNSVQRACNNVLGITYRACRIVLMHSPDTLAVLRARNDTLSVISDRVISNQQVPILFLNQYLAP